MALFDENEIKVHANGMLPKETYKRIYEYCRTFSPHNVIEIGTAHGASAITIALSAIDFGYAAQITTLDPLSGRITSRSAYGDARANEEIIRRNFEKFGVADIINLFVGTTDEHIEILHGLPRADLIVLDADGRVDRDILNLIPLISGKTRFIIDDYGNMPKITITHDGTTWLDLKHCITKSIVDKLVDAGALEIEEICGGTLFLSVANASFWSASAITKIALMAYREIIFVELDDSISTDISWQLMASKNYFDFEGSRVLGRLRQALIRRLL